MRNSFCHFITFRGPAAHVPEAGVARIADLVSRVWLQRHALVHTPAQASDPFLAALKPLPLVLQIFFDDIDRLESFCAPDTIMGTILAEAAGLGLTEATQQTMLARGYVSPPADADRETWCSYLVSYEGEAENLSAWHQHYIDKHVPLMQQMPGIMGLEVYTRIDSAVVLPLPRDICMQRNRVVFETQEALTAALNGPIRAEMRKDFHAFPRFTGGNVHFPMTTRVVLPVRGFSPETGPGGGAIVEERRNGVVTLWIANERKSNALSLDMLEALTASAERLAREESVRVVVLRGAGGNAFSAGADFASFDTADRAALAASVRTMTGVLDRCTAALAALPQPVVAVIEGACFGGAVQLALAANIRLASGTARLAIPAAKLGIVYPVDGIRRLQQLVGPGRAQLALMTGRAWQAAEAYHDGLIDVLVPQARLEAELERLRADLLAAPKATLTAYKRILSSLARGEPAGAAGAIEAAANAGSEMWHRLRQVRKAKP